MKKNKNPKKLVKKDSVASVQLFGIKEPYAALTEQIKNQPNILGSLLN
jgi:hypothetical protein